VLSVAVTASEQSSPVNIETTAACVANVTTAAASGISSLSSSCWWWLLLYATRMNEGNCYTDHYTNGYILGCDDVMS